MNHLRDTTLRRLGDKAFARCHRFMKKRHLAFHRFRAPTGGGVVSVKIEGLTFELNLDEPTDLGMYVFRDHPGGSDLQLCLEALKPGDVVFDIGANMGYYSACFSRAVGETGCVHAFEPNGRILPRLHGNLRRNGCTNVTVVEAALGDASGALVLSEVDGGDPGSATLVPARGRAVTRTHEVAVRRLDDYVREAGIDRLTLVKIDVEGFERNVLAGGEETIARFRPRLLIEAFGMSQESRGSSIDELVADLQRLGYDTYKSYLGSRTLMAVRSGQDYGRIFDLHCLPRRP